MRCLTVTGRSVASRMARTQSATTFGVSIRHAPKLPFCTRGEGQPQLRLYSSYPQAEAMRIDSASSAGSDPPSWSATGCSTGVKPRSCSRLPKRIAPVVTISV